MLQVQAMCFWLVVSEGARGSSWGRAISTVLVCTQTPESPFYATDASVKSQSSALPHHFSSRTESRDTDGSRLLTTKGKKGTVGGTYSDLWLRQPAAWFTTWYQESVF